MPSIFLSQGFSRRRARRRQFARNVTLVSWDRSSKVPTSQQWNVNVQRELPGAVLLEVGYTGNWLYNDWLSLDGNPAPPGAGDINARRRYQTAVVPGSTDVITLANVVRIQKDGWLPVQRAADQAREALLAAACRSWRPTRCRRPSASAIRPAAPTTVPGSGQSRGEEAPGENDRRHKFVVSGIYEMPFGRTPDGGASVAKAIFGGWSVSPILTIVSGAPLNLTVNGNPSNTGQSDRPNVVGDWQLDNPTVEQWFNTAAFVANDRYTLGNAPRNLLRGPGTFNLDLALRKAFPISRPGPRRGAARAVQRHQHDAARQSQHAGGQPELRPHPHGRSGPQHPALGEVAVLARGRWSLVVQGHLLLAAHSLLTIGDAQMRHLVLITTIGLTAAAAVPFGKRAQSGDKKPGRSGQARRRRRPRRPREAAAGLDSPRPPANHGVEHSARAGRAADLLASRGFTVAGAIGAQDYEAEGGVLVKPAPLAPRTTADGR